MRGQTVNAAVKEMLYRVWDSLHFLFGNGSWTLSAPERLVADAAIGIFSSDIRSNLEAQLRQSYFVERMSRGRINVIRFYAPDDRLRVQDSRFADLLVDVRIAVDGQEQVAHLVCLRGYLFSIEFRDRAARYADRHIEVRGVKLGNPKKTYTRALDRLEHGDDAG